MIGKFAGMTAENVGTLITTGGVVAVAWIVNRTRKTVNATKAIVENPDTGIVATHAQVNSNLARTEEALEKMTERVVALTDTVARLMSERDAASRPPNPSRRAD